MENLRLMKKGLSLEKEVRKIIVRNCCSHVKGITEIMNATMEMIDEEVVIRHEEEAKEDSQEIVRMEIVMIETRETMEIKNTIGETLEK